MINSLFIIHTIVSILLIMVILLQKTNADGVNTLSGNNLGIMGVETANNFLVKTTTILAIIFGLNLLLIGNYYSNLNKKVSTEQQAAVKVQ